MIVLYYLIVNVILFRTIYSNIMLLISVVWLAKNRKKIISKQVGNAKKFIIIIPVLREREVLKKTLYYFLSMNYSIDNFTIILVSTQREVKEASNGLESKTTIDLAGQLEKEANEKFDKQVVTHLHYPFSNGKMVDQVNYAFDYILKSNKKDFDSIFVGIYNADSRPNVNTFSIISSLAKDKKYKVFQQSALFFDNFSVIKSENNFFIKNYLISNAVLHSRWTLAHEVPRLLRQSFFINYFHKRFFLSHCVGHGLFLRLDFLKRIRSIPSTTLTEDLFFGYILSSLGESINPVPVLESAEAPTSLLSALRQKYVWFFGPADHFSYEKFFKNKFPSYSNLFILKWFTFQGIFAALAWLLMGWLFLFIFLYPIAIHRYDLLLLSILLFLFYGPFSYIIVLFVGSKFNTAFRSTYKDYFSLIPFSFLAILLHSIPPIVTLIAKVNYFFTRQEPCKPKTER